RTRWCLGTTTNHSDRDCNRGFWTEWEKSVEQNLNSQKKTKLTGLTKTRGSPETMATG
uniref:Uncharacterized protein n=1 Tax=Loxodonta africana TaxID=9785 RepID=G3UFL6_LOXAF